MKLTIKDYKTLKIKKYLKKQDLFLVLGGINKNSNDWVHTEQGLKNINFKHYKIFNRTALNVLNNSIFTHSNGIINGLTFFVNPLNHFEPVFQSVLFQSFEPLLFVLLGVKLNNKMYEPNQIKSIYSLTYLENKLLFYKFNITSLKLNLKCKNSK